MRRAAPAMLDNGVGFSSSSDTEVITMMLAGGEGDTWNERLKNTDAALGQAHIRWSS